MKTTQLVGVSAVAAWAALVAVGFAAWYRYEHTPGDPGPPPQSPAPAGAAREVVAYVHPRCPCSRATVAELAALALAHRGSAGVTVVLVLPPGGGAGWEHGPVLAAAERLGLGTRCDAGGREAVKDGATTSGHVVARDAQGRVVFTGGVTPARGRTGDCLGRRAVVAVLGGDEPPVRAAPVFGYTLLTPGCVEGGSCRP